MNRGSQTKGIGYRTYLKVARCSSFYILMVLCSMPSTGQTSASAFQDTFRSSVEQISLEQGSLERITVTAEPAFPFRPGAEGYRPGEVQQVLQTARQNMLQATSSIPALRAYIEVNFPTQVSTVETWKGPLVTVESANASITSARNFAAKLSGINDYTVDFTVSSAPTEAGFFLVAVGGGEEKTTTTDSRVENVYRGLYEYRVEKAGYKPIRYGINLVDSDFKTLRCKLYKADEKDGPYPCQMQ